MSNGGTMREDGITSGSSDSELEFLPTDLGVLVDTEGDEWIRREDYDAERSLREAAEKVIDAIDLITPLMCESSKVPRWMRLRLKDIVEVRNQYRERTLKCANQ